MPYSSRASGIIAMLADRPVAYHPKLAIVIGVKETIFVCQLLYWDGKGRGEWIWKTQNQFTEETGLSGHEQRTVRRNLLGRGILETKRVGIPAKLHYKLDFDNLALAIEEAYSRSEEPQHQEVKNTETKKLRTPKPRSEEPSHQEVKNTDSKMLRTSTSNVETIIESTLENKRKTSANAASVPVIVESARVTPSRTRNSPASYREWWDSIASSQNKVAGLMKMFKALYSSHDPPSFAYMGRVVKKHGWGAMARLLWDCNTYQISGDVLAYIQAVSKGQKKKGGQEVAKSEEEYSDDLKAAFARGRPSEEASAG